MMQIKIQCGCGQKYAFEAEPADDRLGHPVQCPVCGADGAAAADQCVARHLAARTSPVSKPRLGGTTPAPAIPAPAPPPSGQPEPDANFTGGNAGRKWLVPALGGAGALVLILAGAAWAGRGAGPRIQSAEPVAAAKDGLPRTLGELNLWYVEPPAGGNAASFHTRGFEALQTGKPATSTLPLLGQGKLPPLGAPMPGPMKAPLAAFVRSNQEALRLFAEGAQCGQSRYPLDLTEGIMAPAPHVLKLRKAALALELSAIWHAEGGDGGAAANDLLAALALARSLEAEPWLTAQKTRAALVSIAVAALEQTVNRADLPPESLGRLVKTLKGMEDYDARGEGFNRALAGERVMGLALLESPRQMLELVTAPGMDVAPDKRGPLVARLQQGGNLTEECESYGDTLRQLLAAREEGFPGRLRTDDLIRQRLAGAAAQKLAVIGWLLPGLAGTASREAGTLAECRLGLTAAALEQFRAAHGNRYPGDLAALTPDYLAATPVDPFDGQPLRYNQNGPGYVLSSAGPDLQDDSGAMVRGKAGGLVFTMARRPKTGE